MLESGLRNSTKAELSAFAPCEDYRGKASILSGYVSEVFVLFSKFQLTCAGACWRIKKCSQCYVTLSQVRRRTSKGRIEPDKKEVLT